MPIEKAINIDNELIKKSILRKMSSENKTVAYWIELSEYDLNVAGSLSEKGHYLYIHKMIDDIKAKDILVKTGALISWLREHAA